MNLPLQVPARFDVQDRRSNGFLIPQRLRQIRNHPVRFGVYCPVWPKKQYRERYVQGHLAAGVQQSRDLGADFLGGVGFARRQLNLLSLKPLYDTSTGEELAKPESSAVIACIEIHVCPDWVTTRFKVHVFGLASPIRPGLNAGAFNALLHILHSGLDNFFVFRATVNAIFDGIQCCSDPIVTAPGLNVMNNRISTKHNQAPYVARLVWHVFPRRNFEVARVKPELTAADFKVFDFVTRNLCQVPSHVKALQKN